MLGQNKSLVDLVTFESDKKISLNSKIKTNNEIDSYKYLQEIIFEITKGKHKYIYDLISKDYTIINRFCLVCTRDQNYDYPEINPNISANYDYKKKLIENQFINDINNESFTTFKNYFKEKKCPHSLKNVEKKHKIFRD